MQAADFADRIGESAGAQYRCVALKIPIIGFIFRSVADDVAAAIVSHWNGDYLYESENRYREVGHSRGMKFNF